MFFGLNGLLTSSFSLDTAEDDFFDFFPYQSHKKCVDMVKVTHRMSLSARIWIHNNITAMHM